MIETAFSHEEGVSPLLLNNVRYFLPGQGKRALDVAVRDGTNALFLVRHGFYVEAIGHDRDLLQKVAEKAEKNGAHLKLIHGDPAKMRLQKEHYDLIVCLYYVNRNAILQMKQALKPEGIVVMESFTQEQLRYSQVQPELVLKPKELLFFFKDFNVLKYEERLLKGPKAVAGIVAKKVKSTVE
jgi:tellurite methyltransferase